MTGICRHSQTEASETEQADESGWSNQPPCAMALHVIDCRTPATKGQAVNLQRSAPLGETNDWRLLIPVQFARAGRSTVLILTFDERRSNPTRIVPNYSGKDCVAEITHPAARLMLAGRQIRESKMAGGGALSPIGRKPVQNAIQSRRHRLRSLEKACLQYQVG